MTKQKRRADSEIWNNCITGNVLPVLSIPTTFWSSSPLSLVLKVASDTTRRLEINLRASLTCSFVHQAIACMTRVSG